MLARIRDVAARAGVAVGTVSRVMNGLNVSAELREKVLAAADELDWTPHRVARNLRTGRSQTVGLIVVDITHPFYPDLVRAAEATLESSGLTLLLANTYDDVDREDRILDLMLEQRVAGVLMSPANGNSTLVDAFRRAEIPVVFVDAAPAPELGTICAVYADDVAGGRQALGHLLDLGHRRILLINGPDWMRQCADRERGARDAIAAHEAALDTSLTVVRLEALSYRAGEQAAAQILADGWSWSAVFCVQDTVAVGVQRALQRAGVDIPAQVSVIGYDNVEAAAFAPVPLTSVGKPRAAMGSAGAELLLTELHQTDTHEHTHRSLDTHLVVRESTRQVRRPGSASRRGDI